MSTEAGDVQVYICRPSQKRDKESNMSNEKVSICVPTYNRPHLISKLLDSILVQTYQNFEIFITDNSNNSETAELINNKYQDPRISYLKNSENLGMDGNTLKVLSFVTGKYFTFTPDDDVWIESTKLENQVALLSKYPKLNVCFSNVRHINYNGTIHSHQFKSKVMHKHPCEIVDSKSLLLTEKNRDFVNILTAVMRVEILDIFKESWKYGSEEYFMWYLGGTGQKIGFCYKSTVAHRDGEHNWDISDGDGNLVNYRCNAKVRANQLINIYAGLVKTHGGQLSEFNYETEKVLCQIVIDLIGGESFKYKSNFNKISSLDFLKIYFYIKLKHGFRLFIVLFKNRGLISKRK